MTTTVTLSNEVTRKLDELRQERHGRPYSYSHVILELYKMSKIDDDWIEVLKSLEKLEYDVLKCLTKRNRGIKREHISHLFAMLRKNFQSCISEKNIYGEIHDRKKNFEEFFELVVMKKTAKEGYFHTANELQRAKEIQEKRDKDKRLYDEHVEAVFDEVLNR